MKKLTNGFTRKSSRWITFVLASLGLAAIAQAIPPKQNNDIGAFPTSDNVGWAQIIPKEIGADMITSIPEDEKVTIFADFKPLIFNGAPTLLIDGSWDNLPSGWYEAMASINDPWWTASPVKVPIYVSGALCMVNFETQPQAVSYAAGQATVLVSTSLLFNEKIAFLAQNAQNIQIEPAILDFSKSKNAVITLTWDVSGKNAPSPGTVGLILNPQSSERLFVTHQNTTSVSILPPPPVTPSGAPDNQRGFVEKKTTLPASLPQMVSIAPMLKSTIHCLSITNARIPEDVVLTWNPEITPVSAANATRAAANKAGENVLYFRVPANVTPIFTLKACPGFVPAGKSKTVNMTLAVMDEKTSMEYAISNSKTAIQFFSDAPIGNNDEFAFRSVSLVILRPLDVLANDRNAVGTHDGLFVGTISDRPNLSVSSDSTTVLYTLPANADSILGFTDSFYYTLENSNEPVTVYVTTAQAGSRNDSRYYTAAQLTGENVDILVSKPSFYGQYLPLYKNKVRRVTLKNVDYNKNDPAGAQAQLNSTISLLDKKMRTNKTLGFKNSFFADIAPQVQIPAMGLQLFTKVKLADGKLDRPFAAWTLVPPQPDTYYTLTDVKGDSYLVVIGDYFSAKPKLYLESMNHEKIKKTSLTRVKWIELSNGDRIVSTPKQIVIRFPKKFPDGRADLIIDSLNALGYVKEIKFNATMPQPVPFPDYLR